MKTIKQVLVAAALTAMANVSFAGTVGINFQSNPFGFGPYAVSSFGSAYGAAAADWLEVGPQGGAPATGGFSYTAAPFSSPAMNGGTLNVSWSAAGEYCAFGYCYANEGNSPTTGEEAVLSGTLFGTTPPNTQGDHPIVVTLTGLKSFASSYTVKLVAAQDDGDSFHPAQISDGTTQETRNFPNVTQGGLYNVTRMSPQDVETSANTYTGDTLTITIAGVDGDTSLGARTRNALAGVVIDFTRGSTTAPVISISQSGGNVTLTWTGGGTLQAASAVAGAYNPVAGAVSPYTTAATGTMQFFRVSVP